ncbi:MAG: hypothetical protein ACREXX_21475 [Gammaproteobacteria bacterium]
MCSRSAAHGHLGIESDLAACFRLPADRVGAFVRLGVRVGILSLELARDPFRVDDRADEVDRPPPPNGGMQRR